MSGSNEVHRKRNRLISVVLGTIGVFGVATISYDPQKVAERERVAFEEEIKKAEEARISGLHSWVGATVTGSVNRQSSFSASETIVMRTWVGGDLKESDGFVFWVQSPGGGTATCDERNGLREAHVNMRNKTTSSCQIAPKNGNSYEKGQWRIWSETRHGVIRAYNGGKAEWAFTVH